jgi:hypothetical protein
MMPYSLTPVPVDQVGEPIADPFSLPDRGGLDDDDDEQNEQDEDEQEEEEEQQDEPEQDEERPPRRSVKSRFVDVEPADRVYRLIHAVADKFFNNMWRAAFAAADERKEKIDMRALTAAMAAGESAIAFTAVGMDALQRAQQQKIGAVFTNTFEQAAKTEARYVDQLLERKQLHRGHRKADDNTTLEGRFDMTNPRAIQAVRTAVANLIREISHSQRQAVREIIELAFIEGLPPARSAQLIREVVGLTRRQAAKVAAFEVKLYETVGTTTEIQRRVERYAAAQLRQRSMMIARTETINAASAGQRELWRQAVDQGYLPSNQKRRWIVTPDDRLDEEVCEPMTGQEVGLNEPFTTGDGRKVMGPTAHPNCRCSQRLVLK